MWDLINEPDSYLYDNMLKLEAMPTQGSYQNDFSIFDLRKPLKDQIKPISKTRFEWIDSPEQMRAVLAEIRKELSKVPLLAVDLEYAHADRTMLPGESSDWIILAIIQLSTFDSDYIFDCYSLRDAIRQDESSSSLRAIFSDKNVTKIMHGSDTDIKYLVSDLDICTINLFDTARALSFIQKIPPPNEIRQDN